jgi:hypothetical protein
VLNLVRTGRGSHAWFLLNFALWWKEFIEGKSPSLVNKTEALVAIQ